MTNSISGGGLQPIDPSQYGTLESIVEEHADVDKVTAAGLLNAQKDTVQSLAEVGDLDALAGVFDVSADSPTLPPGQAQQGVADLLAANFEGADTVMSELTNELPGELGVKIQAGMIGDDPDLQGIQHTIGQVASAAALSESFLAGLETSPEQALKALEVNTAGAVDPNSTPLQQNTQVATNAIFSIENQVEIGEALLDELPDGPAKDSLSAFLKHMSEALQELQEFLETMNLQELDKPKYMSKGDDRKQLRDAKIEEAKKEAESKASGGLFGFIDDIFGGLLSGILGFLSDLFSLFGFLDFLFAAVDQVTEAIGLDMLTEMLNIDGITDAFKGLYDFKSIVETILNDPTKLVLTVALVALTVMLASMTLGAAAPLAGLAMALLLSAILQNEDNALTSFIKEIPIVGEIWDLIIKPIQDILEKVGISGLLRFGDEDEGTKGKKEEKERVRSRNAGTSSVNASLASSATEHAAKMEGDVDENAELKAQISKLINLLRSIVNGNASPEQLQGPIQAALSSITTGGLEELVGGEVAGSLQKAANAGNNGDVDAMVNLALDAFGVDADRILGKEALTSSIVPSFNLTSFDGLANAA